MARYAATLQTSPPPAESPIRVISSGRYPFDRRWAYAAKPSRTGTGKALSGESDFRTLGAKTANAGRLSLGRFCGDTGGKDRVRENTNGCTKGQPVTYPPPPKKRNTRRWLDGDPDDDDKVVAGESTGA
jgi:hypothetical protein